MYLVSTRLVQAFHLSYKLCSRISSFALFSFYIQKKRNIHKLSIEKTLAWNLNMQYFTFCDLYQTLNRKHTFNIYTMHDILICYISVASWSLECKYNIQWPFIVHILHQYIKKIGNFYSMKCQIKMKRISIDGWRSRAWTHMSPIYRLC